MAGCQCGVNGRSAPNDAKYSYLMLYVVCSYFTLKSTVLENSRCGRIDRINAEIQAYFFRLGATKVK